MSVPKAEHDDSPPIWSAYARLIEEHDEIMVKGWNEEIDTLLVFVSTFLSSYDAPLETAPCVPVCSFRPASSQRSSRPWISKHTSSYKQTLLRPLFSS